MRRLGLILCVLVSIFAMPTSFAATAPTVSPAAVSPGEETVVLLHGVALNRWFTARLARRLRADGFEVVNLTYPSRTRTIAELGDAWLPDELARRGIGPDRRVNFVAHSMGGLVVRRYLASSRRPAQLGRVVMIATPNHGSALADHLRTNWVSRLWIGRNLGALGTGPDAAWRALPPAADFELGVLAGDRPLNPGGRLWLRAPHDGTVEVASTHVDGEADHRVLPFSHSGILFRRETARQAAAFLREGRFAP